jgi:dephospho-CoA kinase
MLRVGLTGGVAAGKSSAGRFFAEMGARVHDADEIVAGLYAPGRPGAAAVAGLFGPELLDSRGAVDKKKLAALVFEDSAARQRLEEAIHPLVREEIGRRFASDAAAGAKVSIVEASQIFESGSENEFDRVVLVVSPEILRMKRWRENGIASDEVARRMAAQIVENEARKKADDVLVNAGTLDDLRAKVAALYESFVSGNPLPARSPRVG